jgi:hypothetical protein
VTCSIEPPDKDWKRIEEAYPFLKIEDRKPIARRPGALSKGSRGTGCTRAKAICDSAGATRESLASFYGDGTVTVRGAVEKAIRGINGGHARVPPIAAIEAPADLEAQVREHLNENPENPWEAAVEAIADSSWPEEA